MGAKTTRAGTELRGKTTNTGIMLSPTSNTISMENRKFDKYKSNNVGQKSTERFKTPDRTSHVYLPVLKQR